AAMQAGLGAAFYANGQFEAAARRICEASDLRPLESEPYLLLGKMEEAAAEPLPCSEEKLARFAEQRPEDARANYYYGLVLWKRGRKSQSQTDPLFERAKSLFTKALAIDPAFAEAYVQLGLIVSAQGHLQETIRIYQKAVEANPKFALAHYQLSLAYRRAGKSQRPKMNCELIRRLSGKKLWRQKRNGGSCGSS